MNFTASRIVASNLRAKLANLEFYNVYSVNTGNIVGYTEYSPGHLESPMETDSVYANECWVPEGKSDTWNEPGGRDTFNLYNTAVGFPPLEHEKYHHIPIPITSNDPQYQSIVEEALSPVTAGSHIDVHFDDYTVTTYNRPRLAYRERATVQALRLDMKNRCDFVLGKKVKNVFAPLSRNRVNVPPTTGNRNGSLIAVIIDKEQLKTGGYRWFVTSHQFMKFWTLLMFGENHKSFDKNHGTDGTGQAFRRWLCQSTTLTTHGYRKWALGYYDHGFTTPSWDEEKFVNPREEKYYRNHEDWSSRSYCHIYLALAFFVHYGELPIKDNLPYNRRGHDLYPVAPPLLHWDLPRHFMRNILMTFGADPSVSPMAVHAYGDKVDDEIVHAQRTVVDFDIRWIDPTFESSDGSCGVVEVSV